MRVIKGDGEALVTRLACPSTCPSRHAPHARFPFWYGKAPHFPFLSFFLLPVLLFCCCCGSCRCKVGASRLNHLRCMPGLCAQGTTGSERTCRHESKYTVSIIMMNPCIIQIMIIYFIFIHVWRCLPFFLSFFSFLCCVRVCRRVCCFPRRGLCAKGRMVDVFSRTRQGMV